MAKSATHPVHALTLGTMVKGLKNTAHIMDTAEKHATEKEIPLDNLLQARLFPDMFNLLQQLQYICYLSVDFAKNFTAEAAPRVGYDEASWVELRKSLDVAADYLAAIAPGNVDTNAAKVVPTFMDDSKGMTAVDYAAEVIVPDFHFHMVVAYALLRHNGVAIGKSDYFGDLDMRELS